MGTAEAIQRDEAEIIESIETQRGWLNLQTMTEEELLALEIPEGELYRTIRVVYNGNPSSIRLVRLRDGSVQLNVDFVQNVFYVRERLENLYRELGELRYQAIELGWQ